EKSRTRSPQALPWQSLNFLPLPHGHGALRGVFSHSDFTTGVIVAGGSATAAGAAAGPVSDATRRAAAAMPPPAPESSGAEYCMFCTNGSSPPIDGAAPLPLPLEA